MSNIEDFRRHLKQAPSIKANQDAFEVGRIEAARKQQQQEEQRRLGLIAAEAMVLESQQNQKILELESRFHIKEHIEALKDEVAPAERVGRWGPKEGTLLYAFSYGFRIEKIIERRGGFVQGFASDKGGGHSTSYYVPGKSHFEARKNVFGVILNHYQGRLSIYNSVVGHQGYRMLAPFVLDPNAPGYSGWDRNNPIKSNIDLDGPDGFRKFTQSLVDFYAELKTGQIK